MTSCHSESITSAAIAAPADKLTQGSSPFTTCISNFKLKFSSYGRQRRKRGRSFGDFIQQTASWSFNRQKWPKITSLACYDLNHRPPPVLTRHVVFSCGSDDTLTRQRSSKGMRVSAGFKADHLVHPPVTAPISSIKHASGCAAADYERQREQGLPFFH